MSCNLPAVYKEILQVHADHSKLLGVQLGLPVRQLDVLERRTGPNIFGEDFKWRMTDLWFTQDEVPTWEKLVEALRTKSVQENVIAAQIEERYIRKGSLTVSDFSSPPSSPMSFGSVPSPSSSLTSAAFKTGLNSGVQRVDTLRLKSFRSMEQYFSDFLGKVLEYLDRKNVQVGEFCSYIIPLYRHESLSRLESISSIFDYLTCNELWDFWNSSHVVGIIEKFGGRDIKELRKIEKDYQGKLSGFLAATKISEYILKNKEKITEATCEVGRPSTARRRSSKTYRDNLAMQLDIDMSTHTLQYVEKLWRSLSYLGLPKIGVVLDCIVYGSVWVIWLVPPHISLEFVKKARAASEFLEQNRILKVLLNDKCIYSAPGSSEEKLTDSIQSDVFGKLSTSESIEEETVEADKVTVVSTKLDAAVESTDHKKELPPSTDEHTIKSKSSEGPTEPEQIQLDETVKRKELSTGSEEVDSVKSKETIIEKIGKIRKTITKPFKRTTISEKLLKACRSKKPNLSEIQKYLAQKDIDVNIREDDEFKWTPLMWVCERKHTELGKLLLKHHPKVNIQDKKEWSALILASRSGDLEMVQGLIEQGAEIDMATNKKWTSLMWAAHKGNIEVAKYLLEIGAFVDFPDENGWTPLMQVSQEGHCGLVNVLLDYNAKVNHQSTTTWCALMAAAKNNHNDVLEALLERGAAVDIAREDASTTLQVASYYKDHSQVMDTLIKHGASVDHQNKDGMTALMLATNKGHLDLVQALINGRADIDKAHPETGWTAIFFAAKSGNREIFRELLRHGAATEIEGTKVTEVASLFKRDKISSELKKYEQSPHKQVSSHVPTLEPFQTTTVEQESSFSEPTVEVPPDETPPTEPSEVERTHMDITEKTSHEGEVETGPLPPEVSETETAVIESAEVKPSHSIDDQGSVHQLDTTTTTEAKAPDSSSSVASEKSDKPTTTAETPKEPIQPVTEIVVKPQQEIHAAPQTTKSTKPQETKPSQKAEVKKQPKDLKRQAEIIELLLKGFEMRLANPKSNVDRQDYNEADVTVSRRKGVAPIEEFAHGREDIHTAHSGTRQLDYTPLDDDLYN